MLDSAREQTPTVRTYSVRPAQFFVALLLSSMAAALTSFIVLIAWGVLVNGKTLGFSSFADFTSTMPGLATTVLFGCAGIMLFAALPATLIGIFLLRTGRISVPAFLLGGLLAGAAGFALLWVLFFHDQSFTDMLASEYDGGSLTAIAVGGLVAGLIGRLVLIGRSAA
jgi:hypothetical protein